MPPTDAYDDTLHPKIRAKKFALYSWAGWFAVNALVVLLMCSLALRSRGAAENEAYAQAADLAQNIQTPVAKTIEQALLAERAMAKLLRDQSRSGRLNLDAAELLVADFERSAVEPQSLRITDKTGRLIIGDGSRSGQAFNFSGRDYFQSLAADPTATHFITGRLMGIVSKKSIILIATPYLDARGAFAGVITCAVSLDGLEKLMRPPGLHPRDAVALRDTRDYTLLARYPYSDSTRQARALPPMAVDAARSEVPRLTPHLPPRLSQTSRTAIDSGLDSGHYVIPAAESSNGMKRLAAFKRIPSSPFVLIVSLDASARMASWRELCIRLAAFALGFLALSAFITARGVRRFAPSVLTVPRL